MEVNRGHILMTQRVRVFNLRVCRTAVGTQLRLEPIDLKWCQPALIHKFIQYCNGHWGYRNKENTQDLTFQRKARK